MNEKSQFFKNLMTAFLAQVISLMASVSMSFILPKFLGITEYSYWQLFIFYIGYVGFFHFGFNDGIYLRLGGQKFEELDFNMIGTQFKLFISIEFSVCLAIIVVANFSLTNPERRFIWVFTGIYLLLNNLATCLGFIFQAVNKTKVFSISSIIDRIFVLFFIMFLLWRRQTDFKPFIVTYTLSKAISLIYCIWMARKIIFSKLVNIHKTLADMWLNFSIGIKLTIATIMSMFILGIGRIMIDHIWGIEAFGKISLSLSLSHFFLVFIQQVSMVLFPALRRTENVQQKKIYNMIRTYMGLLLPTVFIAYFPINFIVNWWLPQYNESLKYFALLLPLCTFDGKMQMLCNTYLKVLRHEKKLLQFNLYAFIMSLCLTAFSGYVLHSLTCIVVSMVMSIMFRSIIAELFLAKEMEIHILRSLMQEIALVLIFVFSIWFCSEVIAFLITIIAYGMYLFFNRTYLKRT